MDSETNKDPKQETTTIIYILSIILQFIARIIFNIAATVFYYSWYFVAIVFILTIVLVYTGHQIFILQIVTLVFTAIIIVNQSCLHILEGLRYPLDILQVIIQFVILTAFTGRTEIERVIDDIQNPLVIIPNDNNINPLPFALLPPGSDISDDDINPNPNDNHHPRDNNNDNNDNDNHRLLALPAPPRHQQAPLIAIQLAPQPQAAPARQRRRPQYQINYPLNQIRHSKRKNISKKFAHIFRQ